MSHCCAGLGAGVRRSKPLKCMIHAMPTIEFTSGGRQHCPFVLAPVCADHKHEEVHLVT